MLIDNQYDILFRSYKIAYFLPNNLTGNSGARRASWRVISSIEQKEEGKSGNTGMIKTYRDQVLLS